MTDGFGELSSEESVKQRDAANDKAYDRVDLGAFETGPQSLSEAAAQGVPQNGGMENGLSSLGDGETMNFNAAIPDEDMDLHINAALPDEEEDTTINAGRSEDDDIVNSEYSESNRADIYDEKYVKRNSLKGKGGEDYDIGNIFIANSYDSRDLSTVKGNAKKTSTMYDPEKDKNRGTGNVHFAIGMPRWLKLILGWGIFFAILYCVLEYGFKLHLEYYKDPIPLQQFSAASEVTDKTGLSFEDDSVDQMKEGQEMTYQVQKHGDSVQFYHLENTDAKYISLSGLRLEYCIYGVRPSICDTKDASKILVEKNGFVSQGTVNTYLGIEGIYDVYYNQKSDEVVLCQHDKTSTRLKSIKYIRSKKLYEAGYRKAGGEVK